MSRQGASRGAIVWAIVAKDLRTFLRDRFWLFMSALAVLWFVGLYYVLPDTVDETVRVGVHWTERDAAFDAVFAGEEGLDFVRLDTLEGLEDALGLAAEESAEEQGLWQGVRDTLGLGDDEEPEAEPLDIGIAYPDDFLVRVHLTMPTTVTLYVAPEVPAEVRGALATFIRESAYAITGHALPVRPPEAETVVLGEDRLGAQEPLRSKMRPLYAFIALMLETFALGALIADEISSRTVTAILATPARVSDFLAAKGVVGTAVAFTEAVLLLVLVRAFFEAPLQLSVTLLLGAVLATGIALVVGAAGRDFIGTVFYSMLFLIPLMIPAMAELFPGTASAWVKVLPSYGLVQAIVAASSGEATWGDLAPHLAALAAWCAVVLGAGLLVLRRKVATL